jgi:hypothetical protein
VLPAAALLLLVLAEPATAPTATGAAPPASACSLLTGEELAATQGSELADANATALVRDGLAVSRCFFRTRDLARSVSLELTRVDAASPDRDAVRHRWQSMFHGPPDVGEREREPSRREGDAEEAKERGDEEGEPEGKPEPIAGLGDEAFWLGTAAFGALYVLDDDVFVRLSVGGPGDREAKLAQSRALAVDALARLAGGR